MKAGPWIHLNRGWVSQYGGGPSYDEALPDAAWVAMTGDNRFFFRVSRPDGSTEVEEDYKVKRVCDGLLAGLVAAQNRLRSFGVDTSAMTLAPEGT